MSTWSVSTVASYLEQEDAQGLATMVKHNSANGADLLQLAPDTCADDLRCSPFAARKLLQFRDKYLF